MHELKKAMERTGTTQWASSVTSLLSLLLTLGLPSGAATTTTTCRLFPSNSMVCSGWVNSTAFSTTTESTVSATLTLPPNLPVGASPLGLLNLSNAGITALAPYAFENVTTATLDLSRNGIQLIQAEDFANLNTNVLLLNDNAITWLEPGSFDGLALARISLGRNRLTVLSPLTFEGMSAGLLDLSDNRILGVTHLAFNSSAIGNLIMGGNPTICAVAWAADSIMCQCGALIQPTTNASFSNSSEVATTAAPAVAVPPTAACVYCPATLRVDNLFLFNLQTANLSTATTRLSALSNLTVVVGALDFECAGGGVLGDECVVSCRTGFQGESTTYVCSGSGAWVPEINSSQPTCISFPYGNSSSGLEINTSEWDADAATTLPIYGVATEGVPYLVPPPRAYGPYGEFLQFQSFDLPIGLTMNAQGQIFGIPENPGNYTVTVNAIDRSGTMVYTSAFVLNVAPALAITDSRVVYVYRDEYFIYGEMMVVQGGRRPFRYFYEGVLPPGLRLDRVGDGPKISGHPRQTGRWPGIVIEVVDAVGVRQAFPTVSIVVQDPPDGISFRVQFFIALSVSVLLIIASVALVSKHRYADRHDKQMGEFASVSKDYSQDPLEKTFVKTASADCVSVTIAMDVDEAIGALDPRDKLTTGTRIFRKDVGSPPGRDFLVPLEIFIRKASMYSKRILIAAPLNDRYLCEGIEDSLDKLSQQLDSVAILELIRVPYWGKFTPPLNILLRHATMNQDSLLLFQSIELLADCGAVSGLLDHMDDTTLVTGLAIDSCHRFLPGIQPLGGLTAPWNTFAIWNVDLLGRTGFLPISDGVPPLGEEDAGVEEVAAIALLQTLFPGQADAKLVRIAAPLYSWDVDFKCPGRQEGHQKKMHSKMMRPRLQLGALGDLREGTVLHIDASSDTNSLAGEVCVKQCGAANVTINAAFCRPDALSDLVLLDGFTPHDCLEI